MGLGYPPPECLVNDPRLTRALLALDGLSVGDAFGERAFVDPAFVWRRELPGGAPWPWTDDTAMAVSLVETLIDQATIAQAQLASRFAERFVAEPRRGYGAGAARLLFRVAAGAPWAQEAASLFGGTGSYGNGAAMRVAPLGAWLAGEPTTRVAELAARQAEVTHTHHEGVQGAIAVALATAMLAGSPPLTGRGLIAAVADALSPSEVRDRLQQAVDIPPEDLLYAARSLGSGQQVAAFDTVPFCVWVAAHHADDFAEALFTTAAAFGDVDTTCAIVGGMVALPSGRPPAAWLARREPLPALGRPAP